MTTVLKHSILKSIFDFKGNFTPGVCPPVRRFDGVEIKPFRGGALASATISADFEIAWAFRGRSVEERTLRATTCRKNVPILVKILEEESIPITFATVGHLFLDKCERSASGLAHAEMPRPPKNERWEGDWYKHDPCTDLGTDPAWYAPDLIRNILASQVRHEMGSHSFSHIDFSETTSNRDLVRRELEECMRIMKLWGLRLRSLVYPFNNMGHHYLDLIADQNITSVRHRDPEVRLSYPERSPWGVYKLCESMNLRKGNRYDYLDKAKIFLDEAMKRNAAYHIWFHPSDPTEIFENEFRNIIRYMARLRKQGKLWVATMRELTAYCEARERVKLAIHRSKAEVVISFDWSYDIKKYGRTILTIQVPLSRAPQNCFLESNNQTEAISVKLEHGSEFTCLVDVPVNTESLRLVY